MDPIEAPPQPPVPQFDVALTAPDLSDWLPGNTGVPGFTRFDSGQPGPHVALVSLVHGNEIAGAIVLDRLLRARLRPARGVLTIGFANLAAFARFDPDHPTTSRFVDEDMNRVWDLSMLDGPRQSSELDRARQIRPLIESADLLLDLHSMLWPSDPLILCGASSKGRALALATATPGLVVADHGHLSGKRLIDYPPFTDSACPRAAILVEAGQHWEERTVGVMLASVAALLRHAGIIADHPALPPAGRPGTVRFAEVTLAVTAATGRFSFLQPFRGGDVLPRRDTLIAVDGPAEIRTPHDDCLLVMPSLRPSRGHTAVRLARFG